MSDLSPFMPPELAVGEPPITDAELDAAYERADREAQEDAVDLPPLPSYLPEAKRFWQIASLGEAEWAMAHVSRAVEQQSLIVAAADEWRQRINMWEAKELRPLHHRIGFFTDKLVAFARGLREVNPKAKTLNLPGGKVSSRASGARVAVNDEAALVAWALTQDKAVCADIVKLTPKVLVDGLREHVVVGNTQHAVLDCDHWMEETRAEGAVAAFSVGDIVLCDQCGREAPVVDVEEGDALVLDPVTGEPVPGAYVQEASVSFTVTPG